MNFKPLYAHRSFDSQKFPRLQKSYMKIFERTEANFDLDTFLVLGLKKKRKYV